MLDPMPDRPEGVIGVRATGTVTDVKWIRAAVHLFAFTMPAEVRLFSVGQLAEARAWITEPARP